jgi:hypothetical protein
VIKTSHGGVIFTGDCHNGKLTRGEVRCPNCSAPLEERVEDLTGSAYLVCPAKKRRCVTPVKSFCDVQELRAWLEHA